MSPRTITHWALQCFEHRDGHTYAYVFGRESGQRISTSEIAAIDGDVVTTKSGSRYRLEGEPLHNFAGFAADPFDPVNPLANLRDFSFELCARKEAP